MMNRHVRRQARATVLAGVVLVVGFTASGCTSKDNGGVIIGPPSTTSTTAVTSSTGR